MPTRRWWQFSLRTLLLAMLAASLGLGWWAQVIRREQQQAEALRLLAECTNGGGDMESPVPVVRAVNYLHSLGRAEALAVLHRAEQKSTSSNEHFSLRFVIPLLFDRKEPRDKYPERGMAEGEYVLAKDQWSWIEVEQDTPFQTQTINNIDPRPPSNTYLVRWATHEGRFRTSPLRPADDPIGAAGKILERPRILKEEEFPLEDFWVRIQVCVAIPQFEHRLDPINRAPDDWEKFHQECLKRGIHWSENEQNYLFRSIAEAQSRP
jgi:hypothetical protein